MNKDLFVYIFFVFLLLTFSLSPIYFFSLDNNIRDNCINKTDHYVERGAFIEIFNCKNEKYSVLGSVEKDSIGTSNPQVFLYKENIDSFQSVNIHHVLLHELGHVEGYMHQEGNVMSKYRLGLSEEHDMHDVGYINRTTWDIAKTYDGFNTINRNINENLDDDVVNNMSDEELDNYNRILQYNEGRYIFMNKFKNRSTFYSDFD